MLIVKCPKCGFVDDDVWYAPTCGCIEWACPKCKKVVDLEKYTGISAEGCASTEYGLKAVKKLKGKRNGTKRRLSSVKEK